MTDTLARRTILLHVLPIVPFEGWTSAALRKAAKEAGYTRQDVLRLFPRGGIAAVEEWLRQADEEMLSLYANYHTEEMKIHERIALIVRLRLEHYLPHREAVRRALSLLSLPWYAHRAATSLAHTADAMWQAVGDTSTDYNWYTKRALLSAVYSSTLLFWLDDESPRQEATLAFLDRRIANVMMIEKAKSALLKRFA